MEGKKYILIKLLSWLSSVKLDQPCAPFRGEHETSCASVVRMHEYSKLVASNIILFIFMDKSFVLNISNLTATFEQSKQLKKQITAIWRFLNVG